MVMTLVARRRNTNAPFKGKLLMIGDKGVYLLTQEKIDSPPFCNIPKEYY